MAPKSVKEYYSLRIPLLDHPVVLIVLLIGLEVYFVLNPKLVFINQVLTPSMLTVVPAVIVLMIILRMALRRRSAVQRYQKDYLDVLPFARVTAIANSPQLSKRDRKEVARYLQHTHPGWS